RTYMEAQYDVSTLETADKYRGIGIQEFCELTCGGTYLPKFRRDSRGWLEAAFSSMSLPGILSSVANKVLLEGFLMMDDTWKKIVKIASCSNFQQHNRYRMNGSFKFEKVGADGEIKHGGVGEQQFVQQLATHAIMFALTRQMIIDDDLGAFTDIPRGIGVGASEAINDAVWECLLLNANQKDGKPFFGSDHKNLVTGADAKLDIDGLTKAELVFSQQERSEGRPLGIPATILLVPSALKVAAELLMKSLTVNESTDPNKPKPVNNPHAGKFEAVSTPYLSSKAFKKNSSSAWYLFADPRRLAALEVAFLGGQDRPTVERADADFNILGVQFRGYIDFGVKEQDWRGALRLDP
ncbi:MAG: Mu-like prophage major head subunit gpT family protein, partial [Thermoguttaceae bacterium]